MMQLFMGAWKNDAPINFNLSGKTVKQIGIGHPYGIPMPEEVLGNEKVVFSIGEYDYTVGETEVLEFENLDLYSPEIRITRGHPCLTLNVGYE